MIFSKAASSVVGASMLTATLMIPKLNVSRIITIVRPNL